MTRYISRSFALLLSFACLALQLRAAEQQHPNIVFILADDLGWGDIGCYGNANVRTPHLDRLAAEGVKFSNFYSNGTECSPTRTAFLTGRYQQRVGGLECAIGTGNVGRYDDAIRLAAKGELGLPASEIGIGHMLKDAGYATALFGKWHLGYDAKFAPARHGFDYALYCIGGGMDYFHHVEEPPKLTPALLLNGQPVKRTGYYTNLTAEESTAWLDAHVARSPGQPFFLYIPLTTPHSPFQSPEEWKKDPLPADSPRWKQGRAPALVYRAMLENMDDAVGRVLMALERHDLARNSLVVFSSDNGGTGSAAPTGLRAIKGNTFEGGIRVPCIVRWPGVLPAGLESDALGLSFDLTASFAAAAGVQPSADRPFDGIDLLGALARGEAPTERAVFWRGRRGETTRRAVRVGALKYISEQKGPAFQEWLVDLERDPGEKNNLLPQRAADAARLKHLLAEWEKDVRPAR